jgi:hypothetical protein
MCPRVRFLILSTVALVACAIPARADILFFSSGGGFSSKLQELGISDQNVLFNGNGAVNGPALTVTGVTNQSGQLVNITSSELLTGVGGQSPAVRGNDGTFPNAAVAFSDPNALIQSLFFNLDNTRSVDESTVLFRVRDQLGQTVQTQIVNNGNNFFAVIAFNGQALVSADVQVLSSSDGPDVLAQMNQIRISGVSSPQGGPPGGPPPGPGPEPAASTPEPHSVLLWAACGAAGFLGMRRFRARSVRA